MTGGAFFPTVGATDEEYELDEQGGGGAERHAVQWVGKPGVKGPKLLKMPLLTVGMLGIQCVWSIEMGYASPYLLELGLSKSWMSLVFMAGPLSGLFVQPLVGVFADRSKARLGRRRPFMLVGVAICSSAMMLLGWTREASAMVGAGAGLAIALAVWAIYCIDFSINAVMSTDRALVVDTLPPSQQEEGSAWAGRMTGIGSVAGFFVGNLDLPPYLPFLGKSQLQILSFLTSAILLLTHCFTSWAVTERVLLRDDRPQAQNGLISNLKSIWENIFTLPPGIRTVCIVQFFASLGWFPILFFTTVWVSEIYKSSVPNAVSSDAVRSGARALFLQSLVNVTTSICLPFFVAESGVQPSEQHTYASLNGVGEGHPNTAMWKRAKEEIQDGNAVKRAVGWAKGVVGGSGPVLPIKGLHLVDIWCMSQFMFAGLMAASWFVTTVYGAYCVITLTGFCWALSQWAPYSLLGELILIDGTIDRDHPQILHTRPSGDSRRSIDPHRSPSPVIVPIISSTRTTPLHSRHASRTSLDDEKYFKPRPDALDLSRSTSRGSRPHTPGGGLSPLVIQDSAHDSVEDMDTSLVLHHSDEEGLDDGEDGMPYRPQSPRSPISPVHKGKETADKAGVILGIHNVFIVLPQFIVTTLSALIFYLMEPSKSLPEHHPQSIPIPSNITAGDVSDLTDTVRMVIREGIEGGSPDAVGLIFRIGGVSAAIGGYICWRLSRSWARGQGV